MARSTRGSILGMLMVLHQTPLFPLAESHHVHSEIRESLILGQLPYVLTPQQGSDATMHLNLLAFAPTLGLRHGLGNRGQCPEYFVGATRVNACINGVRGKRNAVPRNKRQRNRDSSSEQRNNEAAPAQGAQQQSKMKNLPVGVEVNYATTTTGILEAAAMLPLKNGVENRVGVKRSSISSMALTRLSKMLVGTQGINAKDVTLQDPLFHRLCCVAAEAADEGGQGAEKFACQSLKALATLAPLPKNVFVEHVERIARRVESGLRVRGVLDQGDIFAASWAARRLGVSCDLTESLAQALSELCLPFAVEVGLLEDVVSLTELRDDIPFQHDMITASNGMQVRERRETCWMAEEGVAPMAYSGKIMQPVPFSKSVQIVRDVLQERSGQEYNCCLINYYADANAACQWHRDPDHGTLWAREEAVVSVGETRRFSFRSSEQESTLYSVYVTNGDVVRMFGDCQDRYEHCVTKGEGLQNNSPRISMVFKKSLS